MNKRELLLEYGRTVSALNFIVDTLNEMELHPNEVTTETRLDLMKHFGILKAQRDMLVEHGDHTTENLVKYTDSVLKLVDKLELHP